tara:strand:- start:331 stop:672 length:342 start_codon:yes stop_codon:yes gene_type:complete
MKFEDIEKNLTSLLLRDIVIYIKPEKPIKRGKLKLFKVKDFYFSLFLENEKGDLKTYEIPFPFDNSIGHRHLIFDYRIEKFAKNNDFVHFKSKVLNYKKKSKLYNNIVVLSAV